MEGTRNIKHTNFERETLLSGGEESSHLLPFLGPGVLPRFLGIYLFWLPKLPALSISKEFGIDKFIL